MSLFISLVKAFSVSPHLLPSRSSEYFKILKNFFFDWCLFKIK